MLDCEYLPIVWYTRLIGQAIVFPKPHAVTHRFVVQSFLRYYQKCYYRAQDLRLEVSQGHGRGRIWGGGPVCTIVGYEDRGGEDVVWIG